MADTHRKYPVGSDAWKKRNSRRGTGRRPFAGTDGEGGTDNTGRHHYYLLRAGDQELWNADGTPLSAIQCLEFISGLPLDRTYVGFFFDYDSTMILRDLPLERVRRILKPTKFKNKQGRVQDSAVDYKGYQIMYRQTKYLKVRKWLRREMVDGEPKDIYDKWRTIHDVGSFFQCSFVTAMRQWLGEWDADADEYIIADPRTAEIIDRIAAGKEQRAEFEGLTEYIREYCKLECQQLAKLMERFRQACDGVGLAPTAWQGPGYLVSSAMRRNKFPKNSEYRDRIPDRVWNMANDAYYGGRFEAPMVGNVPGPVHQYDINSAYAGVYRDLPCLVHGTWIDTTGRLLDSLDGYSVCRIIFEHDYDTHLGGLPVRTKKGGILYPRISYGTYWAHEIRATRNWRQLEITESWTYQAECDCAPFDWIDALYQERINVGKKTGKGAILKLVLASTYGKLCQSVGAAPYSNPVWASLITSLVRTQLYRAAIAIDGGKDVVMLATDGLYTRKERPDLVISKEIGDWEHDIHDDMFVVQSGLYFLPHKQPKTRGVPRARVSQHRELLTSAWNKFARKEYFRFKRTPYPIPSVNVSMDRFITLAQAAAWGKLERAGQWERYETNQSDGRAITFDWTNKRQRNGAISRGGLYISDPYIASYPNKPYPRRIGTADVLEDQEDSPLSAGRDLSDGQPDWNLFQL